MNAPETGADGTNASGAGAAWSSPGQARLRQLDDQQAALRRVAMLIGGAEPLRGSGLTGLKDRIEALGGIFSPHSQEDGGTAVARKLPVPAGGGLPDAGHDQ
jgi:hypothetical protein